LFGFIFFHCVALTASQGTGGIAVELTIRPDGTCKENAGVVSPTVCPVLWGGYSAFDFRVLVPNSQSFVQLWCRPGFLATEYDLNSRLGQVSTMGLAYNSTGRYVFRLPAMPLSYQGIATAICIITISVLALTEYPGDVFPGAGFNKDFPVSGSCTDNFSGSVYRMRGCPCASPPADYGCQPSFICDILEGFPTKPNICVEHQFTQKGYQAGTSVTIPPRTVAPCVRLTRCSLCTDRVTCGWCGEQCIDNTGSTMCPTNIAFSCEPEAATTTTSTTTTLVGPTGNPPTTPGEPIEPISAPNGGVTTTTAAAIITTSTIARPQDSTNTQFFAPTDDDASGSNTIAIAAGAGGGAAFLIIVGIIIAICWLKRKKAGSGSLDEDIAMSRYSDAPSASDSTQSYSRPGPPATLYGSAAGGGDYHTSSTSDYGLAPPVSSTMGSADYVVATPNALYANGVFSCPTCGKSFPTEGDVAFHKQKRGH
jgi:hypothetical protein